MVIVSTLLVDVIKKMGPNRRKSKRLIQIQASCLLFRCNFRFRSKTNGRSCQTGKTKFSLFLKRPNSTMMKPINRVSKEPNLRIITEKMNHLLILKNRKRKLQIIHNVKRVQNRYIKMEVSILASGLARKGMDKEQ